MRAGNNPLDDLTLTEIFVAMASLGHKGLKVIITCAIHYVTEVII